MGDFRPGEILGGRYEIIELLGAGGMANVYRAHDPHLGRDVAVKVLADRFAADPAFVERFRREASAAAQLNHPNIVQVFDRGETDHTYFIVMEYLSGPDLKTMIRDRGPLPPIEAVDNALQILGALAAAHRRDVIHRDIKPQNVMQARDGMLKVTDFGIARAGAGADMTEAGSVIGTAQYLSPEQAHGGELTSASDCYSVGVVLYEMLTGQVPFDGERPVAIAMKHINEPPVPPRTYVPTIPQALEAVTLTALAKRPSERYRTAEEFSHALLEVRRTLTADAPGSATMVFPAVAVAASATTVMPAVALGQDTAEIPQAPPPTPPPAQPARRRNRGPAWIIGLIVLLGILAIAGIFAIGHFQGSSGVTVPGDIAGQTQSAAQAELTKLGLVVTLKQIASTDAEKGLAVSTAPGAGASIKKGSSITLNIGNGPAPLAVPNVVGLGQAAATTDLQNAGFAVVVMSGASSSVAQGTVLGQNPAAKTLLAPKQTVTITVSSGPAVPDVVGKSLASATQLLQAAGVQVGTVTNQSSATVHSGLVILQGTPAGSSVNAGARVDLVISTGPATTPVPNVVGLTSAVALANLQSAGFVGSQQTAFDPSAAGTVIAQNPAPGTSLAQGGVVQFTVSLGPQTPPPATTP